MNESLRYLRSRSDERKALLQKLRNLVCNKNERKVCCARETGHLRVRKNLANLTKQETSDLLHALIQAKKSGTYTGPRIQNYSEFNSNFNAAASFHGYPGLCPGATLGGNPRGKADCCWHGDPRFLPWHRLIVMQLNEALRSNKTYENVTLPYWDWTQNFEKLPHLIRDPFITDPISGEKLENPFFHSLIPQKNFTKRSPEILINYNKYCGSDKENCNKSYSGLSKLMNMTLTALEETTYVNFESQIELPHNQVHNQLGFIPVGCDDSNSSDPLCYPYTMQENTYASFDPIFMIFHTMVDFQWAVFQALQKHRGISYASDCHPYFDTQLPPYSTHYNSYQATKSHSQGHKTVDYKTAFGYKYDELKLNGMNISALNVHLERKNNIDRLFAGFSLPNIHIPRITFNACYPITNCNISSKYFQISTLHSNKKGYKNAYKNSILHYLEVTDHLPPGLNASQDIGFKIVSTSSNAKNFTFTPVSIFRKAGTQKDRITVQWHEDKEEYNYAPFFEVRPDRTNSIRFLLENGSMGVYQYPDKDSFQNCAANRKLVHTEIEISGKEDYYFQNPLQTGCQEQNKLVVNRRKPCKSSGLVRETGGNATIGWQVDMAAFSNGICMKPGSFLTFQWSEDTHNVTQLQNENDFNDCTFPKIGGYPAPPTHHIQFPRSGNGFQEDETPYYIVCPLNDHCGKGMKIKICIKENCSSSTTCT
eukprot:GFUD01041066.1.p1 GENE.GFUD01041066.1~~GFUD01041066.1.p1  ORF type:complete len:775 (+),score=125.19 GFUD01041066.1:205-2325(+)